MCAMSHSISSRQGAVPGDPVGFHTVWLGFATGDWEGSRCGIRTRIALQNPVAQVVVAILRGRGPSAIPRQGWMMLIGYAWVSTQDDERRKPGEGPPRRSFGGENTHCVRSRLRRMQAPQRSSETTRLACKIAPICLIPYDRASGHGTSARACGGQPGVGRGWAGGEARQLLKLSRWAEGYEREQGRIRCPQRVENNAVRDRGEWVR